MIDRDLGGWAYNDTDGQWELQGASDWTISFDGTHFDVALNDGVHGFDTYLPLLAIEQLLATHGLKVVKVSE